MARPPDKEERSLYLKYRRDAALAAGRCGRCFIRKTSDGRRWCKKCLAYTRELRRRWLDGDKCATCGRPRHPESTHYCLRCRRYYSLMWRVRKMRDDHGPVHQD